MTEMSAILGGGIVEAKRQMEERLKKYLENMGFCSVLFISLLGMGLFLHLIRCRDDRRLRAMHAAEQAAHTESAGGKGSAECFICMEKIATVVYVPCNHMLACMTCT